MKIETRSDDPWDYFLDADVERFGSVILDRKEQERWSRAVFLGGLPFMWRRASAPRALILRQMELAQGDNVLVLGEAIEGCGWCDEIQKRIGEAGTLQVIEIMDEARDAYIDGRRGRSGKLATWKYDYTANIGNDYFDSVAVLQGVQHADDWRETGTELLRILKPGRQIVLGEIAFGPPLIAKVELDMHIEYLFAKIFKRIGWELDDFPYYSLQQLAGAFQDLLINQGSFEWKGIEIFWGRKP